MTNSIRKKMLLSTLAALILVAGCTISRVHHTGRIWPPPPDQPRIQYLTSYVGPIDFYKSSMVQDVVLGEVNIDYFRKPMGLYVDEHNVLFVADTGRSKVYRLDKKNMQQTTIALPGSGFLKPISVVTDKYRNIYVTDSRKKGLFLFDKHGKFLGQVAGKKFFTRPTGLAIDKKNRRLYVSDTHKHVVYVFDTTNQTHIGQIGRGRGTSEGWFNFPTHMTTDNKGNLYVVDTMNARIQIFDKKGRFLRSFGQFGDGPGMFARPKGIGVDSEGHIYVVDAAFNNVQIFNQEGDILMAFANYGKGRGELILPAGLSIDKEDIIYVSDSWNERVNLYVFLGERNKERKAKGINLIR